MWYNLHKILDRTLKDTITLDLGSTNMVKFRYL